MASAASALSPQGTPVRYAGFWIRFIAAFIDGIIVGVVNGVIGAFIGGGSAAVLSNTNDPATAVTAAIAAAGTSILIGCALSFVYHAFLESSDKQATVGKMVVGIKVTDINGQRLSFGKASVRFFSKIVSGIILYIGFIMAGFTEKKQALHDMIAGTLVVYAK
jgi:uncharacterized RDD family membrane protein YckC